MKGNTHGSPFTVRQPPIKVVIEDVVGSGDGVVGDTVVVEGAFGIVIGNVGVGFRVVVSFLTTSIFGLLSTVAQRRWRQE